ncbi:hypothetical protein FHS23_004621 [Prauserella isguenensis]|uniref:Uncharacterized protein n=1 Tax=Prauserella isguenensis TaxID=1470180 RepID=A0A839SAD1_9PSEU|nr:hypothetical protein [Prauserella isguenensis]MBB3053567.1 hypothetical protein [Prauserella isguenensis]
MWEIFIPNSMAYVGSLCLGLAVILVLVDMPGGAPWAKIGAVIAVIGGFGALGGAAGWVGNHIVNGGATAVSWGERWAGQAIGTAALAVLVLGGVAWAASRIKGKGIATKGSGMGAKFKGLLLCGVLAVVGAVIAAVIPEFYNGADWVVSSLGNAVRDQIV